MIWTLGGKLAPYWPSHLYTRQWSCPRFFSVHWPDILTASLLKSWSCTIRDVWEKSHTSAGKRSSLMSVFSRRQPSTASPPPSLNASWDGQAMSDKCLTCTSQNRSCMENLVLVHKHLEVRKSISKKTSGLTLRNSIWTAVTGETACQPTCLLYSEINRLLIDEWLKWIWILCCWHKVWL